MMSSAKEPWVAMTTPVVMIAAITSQINKMPKKFMRRDLTEQLPQRKLGFVCKTFREEHPAEV